MLFIIAAYFVSTSIAFAYFYHRHMTKLLTATQRETIRLRLRVERMEAKWADLESIREQTRNQQAAIASLQMRLPMR